MNIATILSFTELYKLAIFSSSINHVQSHAVINLNENNRDNIIITVPKPISPPVTGVDVIACSRLSCVCYPGHDY